MGRNNFEVKPKGKSNSRTNTIETDNQIKKARRGKERASSTLDNQDNSVMMNNAGGNVQVSQTGTLLIGPGGRPKTS